MSMHGRSIKELFALHSYKREWVILVPLIRTLQQAS